MRLIDADELMDILPEENVDARMAVLFAPTVDPVTHETAIEFLLNEGWLQQHDRILTESSMKHGQWLAKWNTLFKAYLPCCTVCSKSAVYTFDHCPNCGALMDGDENE